MPIPADVEAHLKRIDPDRWLAARFVGDVTMRDELMALYALNDELARVAESVRDPLIGEMRFAWWREALEGAAGGGGGRGHPVIEALAPALASGRLPLAPLDRMIDARAEADLARAPFAHEAALLRYLDGTAGALMSAAATLLDPGAENVNLSPAGRAWGWAGLWRAREAWTARGRRWTPGDWAEATTPAALSKVVAAKVEGELRAARASLKALPVAAFPAVAHATLARDYARGRTPGEMRRRLQILKAVTLGRV